jgi:hypothetical protein
VHLATVRQHGLSSARNSYCSTEADGSEVVVKAAIALGRCREQTGIHKGKEHWESFTRSNEQQLQLDINLRGGSFCLYDLKEIKMTQGRRCW